MAPCVPDLLQNPGDYNHQPPTHLVVVEDAVCVVACVPVLPKGNQRHGGVNVLTCPLAAVPLQRGCTAGTWEFRIQPTTPQQTEQRNSMFQRSGDAVKCSSLLFAE